MRIVAACSLFLLAILSSFEGLTSNPVKEYYADGSLKAEGSYLKNKIKVGEWRYYYPEGCINAIENYNDQGELHGSVKYFFLCDDLQGEENWSNDLLEGNAVYYYKNGGIEKTGNYKNGMYDGLWRFYFENGSLKRKGSYKNGFPEGKWLIYNEDEVLVQEGYYKEGVEHGEWKFYHEKRAYLEYSGYYENGKRTGDWYIYNKKGKKKKVTFDE